MQLLLEKNAEISEEMVIDDGASVDESVADSEGPSTTLDYESSADEVQQLNGKSADYSSQSNEPSRVSNEAVSVDRPKKTFAAPKPPEDEVIAPSINCSTGELQISNVAVEEVITISVPDESTASVRTAVSSRDALSPSGKEAFDILDDLNSALESHTSADRRTPSTATQSAQSSPHPRPQMLSHLSLDAERSQVSLSEIKRQFEQQRRSEEDVSFKRPTPPTQRIKQVARALSGSSSGTASPAMSPSLERPPQLSPRAKLFNKSSSVDRVVHDLVDRVTEHQPLRLCVNADDNQMVLQKSLDAKLEIV